ncbi:hypothetical protein AB0F81_28755 [Actinoplanes sp. NPDC024001]|uniref:hypothetical protein n=1 Tax=Actinoplanes sp. NPDC024001 TaxID=3154598 RepID=UPI0033F136A7
MVDGFAHRDWLGGTGNFVATSLSLLGAVMDPLQAVFAAGVGWLMEHVSLLREPLDHLAGDPKAIEGHARTWYNIERRIYEATDFFVVEVQRSTTAWAAQSVAAYRERALRHADSVQAIGKIADLMSKLTTTAGALIGVFRNTIRDIVAEVVGACISKAVQAVTVVLIPKVAAEVAMLVADTSRKILRVMEQLLTRLKELGGIAEQCGSILAKVGQSNRNVLRLEASRVEAAGIERSGWNGFTTALEVLGKGHVAAHGPMEHVLVETARSASGTNSSQNAGATGTTLSGDNPEPTPINLPS